MDLEDYPTPVEGETEKEECELEELAELETSVPDTVSVTNLIPSADLWFRYDDQPSKSSVSSALVLQRLWREAKLNSESTDRYKIRA